MDTEEIKKEESQPIKLSAEIEAVLFWKGEPLSIKKLSTILNRNEEEITVGLKSLEEEIQGRGVELIYKDDEVTLGTASNLSDIVEKLTKEELVRDLGKAGLETISIIAYKGPISRAEIDYIRGVQSNFILRNLQIRGLIEKIPNEEDHRSFLYRPSFELLSFLGVSRIEDLPEYEAVKEEFAKNNITEEKVETEQKLDSGNDSPVLEEDPDLPLISDLDTEAEDLSNLTIVDNNN